MNPSADRSQFGAIQNKLKVPMEISITDSMVRKSGHLDEALHYYEGQVKFSSIESATMKATILCFHADDDIAQEMDKNLLSIYNPHVMRSLGHGRGVEMDSTYTFLALPFFKKTFADYFGQHSVGVGPMERFTAEFIQITGGLHALHSRGFYCPTLSGKDIAIVQEKNLISAKLWNFRECLPDLKKIGDENLKKTVDEDLKKNSDWKRLGALLNRAGFLRTLEGTDLFDKMRNGKLTGMDILKHSALLSVRQKFDNVLAVNLHISLHYSKQVQGQTSSFLNRLDDHLDWKHHRPEWIRQRRLRQNLPSTLRGFVKELRDIIEHEVEYLPPKVTVHNQIYDDLERQIRRTWARHFLDVQEFAAQLKLQY